MTSAIFSVSNVSTQLTAWTRTDYSTSVEQYTLRGGFDGVNAYGVVLALPTSTVRNAENLIECDLHADLIQSSTNSHHSSKDTGSSGSSSATSGTLNKSSSTGGGLSGGAIAGIVIGIVAVVAVLAGIFWFGRRRQKPKGSPSPRDPSQEYSSPQEMSAQERAHAELHGKGLPHELEPRQVYELEHRVELPEAR